MNPESILLSTFTPDGRKDPYPALSELRKIAPVHYSRALDSYFLTRFDDCHAALTDPHLRTPDLEWYDREVSAGREHPAAEFFYSSMLRANSPLHDRMRRMVGAEFTARRMAALGSTVEELTRELLDTFADATSGGGAANFQEMVGYPLPVGVVGALIGVPRDEQERFYRYGKDAGRVLEPVRSPEDWARADLAVRTLREYFAELLRRRRADPADGLASTLLTLRRAAEEPLTERELADMLLLVFVAGFETTTSLLGLTLFALLSHPDQLALVGRDPALAPAAVQESLRWDTPVRMTERVAARPLEIGGVAVPEGANVTTVLAAANRDPACHEDPDAFRVRRRGTRLLSFSAGPHFCLGAALARMEGAALVRQTVARFPDLALAGPAVRRDSVSLRTFDVLPLSTRA
ncbi:cytochrome P450 [Streptomyces corynorhini]|uniref:cytochrome P450 n=1 Tax=Streptomyces corynorhini TaxID=2282652 RepID=UPI001314B69E|nr:cytochrome P450 [Streptomyces corynorhini]